MSAPDLELQGALYQALTGSAAVMGLVHAVYHDTRLADPQVAGGAPWGAAEAYISFGPETGQPASFDEINLTAQTVQLDVWSRRPGRVQCKAICWAVRQLLDGARLALPTHAHVSLQLFQHRILPDPDAAITHGVLQFTALIEERV